MRCGAHRERTVAKRCSEKNAIVQQIPLQQQVQPHVQDVTAAAGVCRTMPAEKLSFRRGSRTNRFSLVEHSIWKTNQIYFYCHDTVATKNGQLMQNTVK